MKSDENRFLEKVDKTQTPNGCWIWIGSKRGNGYGSFCIRGESMGAHRFSFELFIGPIPKGIYVLHSCDNPACVRPSHLFLGTQKDNICDMISKGRDSHLRGEGHGCHKLTSPQVVKIFTSSDSRISLSRQYGVSKSCIGHIKKGRKWKHLNLCASALGG